MSQLISVGIIIGLLLALGVSLAAIFKGNHLPSWAKFNPRHSWHNPWIDSKVWLKKILIRIFQGILLIAIFFSRSVVAITKAILKSMGAPTPTKK